MKSFIQALASKSSSGRLEQIEKLLLNSEMGPENLQKAIILSLNELKKCHFNEMQLSRKIENMEIQMICGNPSKNTSRFGSFNMTGLESTQI